MNYSNQIRTKQGVAELIAYRYPELAGAVVKPTKKLGVRSFSAGPLIWLQNRLMESGQYYQAEGRDDDEFIRCERMVGGGGVATVARSKLFSRLKVQIVSPINLASLRVAGDDTAKDSWLWR